MTQEDLTTAITALVTKAVGEGLTDSQIIAALNANLEPFAEIEDRVAS